MERREFDQLILASLPKMERLAKSLAYQFGRQSDWDDVMQDTVERMLVYSYSYDPAKGSIAAFACRVMFNTLLDYRRGAKLARLCAAGSHESPDTADESIMLGELWALMNTEARLFASGYSYAEIMKHTGLSKGSVFNRISKSAELLRIASGYAGAIDRRSGTPKPRNSREVRAKLDLPDSRR